MKRATLARRRSEKPRNSPKSKPTWQLEDPDASTSKTSTARGRRQGAIEIAGIDIDAAADDAVDTDGWEHFLARYDGKSHETDSGLVYWRVN